MQTGLLVFANAAAAFEQLQEGAEVERDAFGLRHASRRAPAWEQRHEDATASVREGDVAGEIPQDEVDERRSQASGTDRQGNITGDDVLAYLARARIPFDLLLQDVL